MKDYTINYSSTMVFAKYDLVVKWVVLPTIRLHLCVGNFICSSGTCEIKRVCFSIHFAPFIYSNQGERPKRRNSCVGDWDDNIQPKSKRSRSKSPVRNFRNEHDDRRMNNHRTNGRSRSPPASRRSSPPLRRSPMRRSSPRRRSPSPKSWLSSPVRRSRSKSPVRNFRNEHDDHWSNNRQLNGQPRSTTPPRRSPVKSRRSSPPRQLRFVGFVFCFIFFKRKCTIWNNG